LALTDAGAEILSSTAYGWDCVVAVSLPAAWVIGASRKRTDLVLHSMYEMDRLPAEWPQVLNGCGLCWVPSAYCERIFRAAGVTVPMIRSGYGVDDTMFHTGGRKPNDGPMKFIAWGTAHVGRKNTLMAARAFKTARLPENDAVLEIKANEAFGEPYFKDADNNNRIIPNITAFAVNWPTSSLADWLRKADVLLYPSGGEGFGLMPLEAMGCGVLPICAYNTGMVDYLDHLPALQVPCPTRVPSASYSAIWGETLYQAQPDFDALVEHIRWCYANRDEVARRGAECAKLVEQNWTWQQAGERALGMLEAHFGHQ
jgi:glycosyltransferase involved in cell wall biosynthesis